MHRHCLDCTTAYAVDLTACPHCRSVRYSLTAPQVAGDRAEAVLPGPILDAPPTAKPAVPTPRKATP